DQPQVHRPTAQVHQAAERLHEYRRDEVARHGGEGRHAEEEHQHGRHQGATAHPGESDHGADDEAAERHGRVHRSQPRSVRWSRMRRTDSSTVSCAVSMVSSASVGSSYGSLTPVNSWISPARAFAYKPLRSRASHTSSGVATWTSTNPPPAAATLRRASALVSRYGAIGAQIASPPCLATSAAT